MKRIVYLVLMAALATMYSGCRSAGTCCCHCQNSCPAPAMDDVPMPAVEPPASETARRSISDDDDWFFDALESSDQAIPPVPEVDQEA